MLQAVMEDRDRLLSLLVVMVVLVLVVMARARALVVLMLVPPMLVVARLRSLAVMMAVLVVLVMVGQVRGIHVTTRSEDSLVREGEVGVLHYINYIIYTPAQALTLHCHTDTPWFLCVWTSSSGGKQCAIQERSVSSVCAGDPRIVISGAATR